MRATELNLTKAAQYESASRCACRISCGCGAAGVPAAPAGGEGTGISEWTRARMSLSRSRISGSNGLQACDPARLLCVPAKGKRCSRKELAQVDHSAEHETGRRYPPKFSRIA